MNKYILKIGLIFVILVAVFIACEQEFYERIDEGTDDSTMTVEEAQAWFEASQPEFLVLKSGDKKKKTKVIKPDWKGAFKSKNGKVEVVETHIVANGAFGYATKDAYNEWVATEHPGYITSLTRLVVLKYKKSGEMVSFLMTVVGDKSYLEDQEFKMWGNTYLVKEKDFNGLVLFHSLEGKFENGWCYSKGKVINTVKLNFEDNIPIQLKSASSTTYEIYEWFEQCTDYYTVGEVDGDITSIEYTGNSCTTYSVYVGSYTVGDSDSDTGDNSDGINPYYVNKQNNDPDPCFSGSGNEVHVYFWEKVSSGDVGHTAIRVGNNIYGYYPTDVNGDNVYNKEDLNNSPGEMHVNDLNEFLNSSTYGGSNIHSYTLAVDSNQRSLLLLAIDYYTQNPGTYSLLGQNCTTVAVDCLNSIGFSFNGSFPNAFERNLSEFNSEKVTSNCSFTVQ